MSRPLIGGTMCVFDKSDLTFLDIKNCLISNYLVNAEYECGMVFYRDKEGLLKFNYSSCLPIHDININYHYDFIEQNSGSIFKTKNDPNTALQQKPLKSMKLKKSSTKEIKEPEESIKQKRERVKSEISILHQRYKTMKIKHLIITFFLLGTTFSFAQTSKDEQTVMQLSKDKWQWMADKLGHIDIATIVLILFSSVVP